MPYCNECGNEVSATDKRCSKCGTLIEPIEQPPGVKKGQNEGSTRQYHNIEFALAIITVVLSVFAISQTNFDYAYIAPEILYAILFFIFIGIIGAILTRYYAKPGAIIVLITTFLLIFSGIPGMVLAVIFSGITLIVAFVLN